MTDYNVAIVHADDWIALYVDNLLVRQDHTLEPEEVLSALNIPYEYIYANHQIKETRRFPESLTSVVDDDVWEARELAKKEARLRAVMNDPEASVLDKRIAASQFVEIVSNSA